MPSSSVPSRARAETITIDQSVEIAVVERSGFVESRHAGAAVVLAPGGEATLTLGDVQTPILPRSSLKPVQALATLTAGAELSGAHLGMATASHSGTDRHADTVQAMLADVGLTADALACPPAMPTDSRARDALVREGLGPERVRMNCSGKHAAMLAACVAAEWPVEGYLDPAHPLQVHIRELTERLTGRRVFATAIDGCGAPVHAVTLEGLARAIQRIATSTIRSPFALHRSAGALVAAVKDDPWTIAGPGQPDTLLIEEFGIFCKGGAEGIMVAAAPDGTTVALKTLDGSGRVGPIVAIALLVRAGALPADAIERAERLLRLDVLGGGEVVGRIRPTI